MSLRPDFIDDVPETTAAIAHVSFPKGNHYLKMRDELGVFFSDEQFADLFSYTGQPALAPWRLALVTVMQFAENLTDRQAANADRSRIDWKYALGLEIDDIGFDLSAVRTLNRLELVGETLHHALNFLAEAAPTWLISRVPLEWVQHYGLRFDNTRLPDAEAEAARTELALIIG